MNDRTKAHAGVVPRGVTLGELVHAEAIRRGGAWRSRADDCARRAETWYGRRPVRGEDLALVFAQVFGTE
ncbi:hypothetical protein [Paraburkholderia adhaesiva]|uniref:hypothetical protein n=1 Tax=Paraburkholderia adhaesiva TaxID=2883244 RepID=UPI001F4879F7|nr:hypothetical protein [Paraburkholderia adhaesiva]